MGLFGFNKKKTDKSTQAEGIESNKVSLKSFRKEYIWGITQGNPMHHSNNKDAFYALIKPLAGEKGTIGDSGAN